MRHWYIIVNPAAGAGTAKSLWPAVEALLQELGFSYTVQFTESRGHATRLAENAILRGHRHLLGIGGDGTNHEIANGILGQSFAPTADIQYALLPVGTGNDWARTYGITKDPRARLRRLLAPETVLQDAGVLHYQKDGQRQTRFFVNVAGLAYDAYVVQQAEKQGHKMRSRLLYLMLIARYLFDYQLTQAKIIIDGQQTVSDYFYTINAGICRYSGGGMQLVPQAVPDDGLLALTYARNVSKATVLMQTPRFYNGTILSHPKIEGLQAKHIRIEHIGDIPTLLEADGEFLGETPVEVAILEKALSIVL